MKKTILFSIAALPLALYAQEDYTLTGKIPAQGPEAKIFMQYVTEGKQVLDSAKIENGAFKFNGSLKEPARAYLILSEEGKGLQALKGPDFTSLYLSKGAITVEGETLKSAAKKGTSLLVDDSKLSELKKPFEDEMESLNKQYAQASPEEQQNPVFVGGLQQKAQELMANMTKADLSFATQNANSLLALLILDENLSPDNVNTVVEPAYTKLNASLKNSPKGKVLGEKIANLKKLALGSVAPDFTLPDTTGTPVALSSLRGKYVLVDFWASWCGPCRHENPTVVAAYNKYKDKNFTVLGVSLDRPGKKEDWLKAIHDDQLQNWPQVSDLKFWQSEVVALYAIKGIPQNYLLDPNGVIIASNLRGPALEAKLAEIIK